jgi:hypothetical protein
MTFLPSPSLDTRSCPSGWQQLTSSRGKPYYYHVADRQASPSLPRVLSMAQELQAQCPFLTPTLTAEAFPAFLERFGQAKSVVRTSKFFPCSHNSIGLGEIGFMSPWLPADGLELTTV